MRSFEKIVSENLISDGWKYVIFQKEKRVDIDNALWPNHLAYNEPNESVEIQYNVLFFYLAPGTWNLPFCEESQGPSVKITHPTGPQKATAKFEWYVHILKLVLGQEQVQQ